MKQQQSAAAFSIQIYADEVKIRVTGVKDKPLVMMEKPKRGNIVYLAKGSVRRLDEAVRWMEPFSNGLVTLTYPGEFPWDGRLVKTHLSRMLKWLQRQGVEHYLWCLEFQKRGAPHFHIIVDYFVEKDLVSAQWYKIVGSGDERHLRAGTKCETVRSRGGLCHYMKQYIRKQGQKEVPEEYLSVGRFWGTDTMLCKPLKTVTYESDKPKHILGAIRPLRKLKDKRRGMKGKGSGKGERAQRGFTLRSKNPEGLVDKFLNYNDGKYPVSLQDNAEVFSVRNSKGHRKK